MNYRHAFHAGNHADVFKHAALTLILEQLAGKPAPFAGFDTHAGLGVYDLTSEDAQRTREFEAGAGLVFRRPLTAAPAYAALLADLNPGPLAHYPGSPEIARRLLRAGDRLVLCELHPDDAAALKARNRGDRRVQVHRRDGYEAALALIPPPERRGLVLIDPPYEQPDEAARWRRRWPRRCANGRPACSAPGTRSRTSASATRWRPPPAPAASRRRCGPSSAPIRSTARQWPAAAS
jgi:23S rRNA (adenine2030-N6)-methyltransferase